MRRIALVFVLLLSACATPDGPITAVYDCANGQRLDVVFEADQAIVTTENGTMATLKDQKPASGIWYLNERYELRGKGRGAQWTIGKRSPITCRAR